MTASDDRFPILIEKIPVHADLGVVHIAEHIPMNAGGILAATFGITGAHRQVDGTAHFLVEEHILGEARDAVVGADAEFSILDT
jgi:hypothetical protein